MIFVFFGHPGAGKTTLARRFGELHGVPAIDTDKYMTAAERRAAATGRYTQAMRLANIRRYREVMESDAERPAHVALADGLPNDAARRFLLDQFPPGAVTLVLVRAERFLWESRLSQRSANPVEIGVAAADAYVRANWEPVAPDMPHRVVENTDDPAAVDAQLASLLNESAAGT